MVAQGEKTNKAGGIRYRQHAGKQQERLPREQILHSFPLIAQASSLVPLQSIVVSELAKSRGKLTNEVYRKSDIWR